MKILILNWRDPKHSWAGGGEIYIFEQAKRWVKLGHIVSVFCGEDKDKDLSLFETVDGIDIYRKGGRYSVYFWAIWYYFSHLKGKADIIIDVVNGIPFFTPLFSRLPKVCYVYHVHAEQFFYEISPPFNYIGYVIEKFIFPLVYKKTPIVAISETTKKQLVNLGFREKNITIIYCGMNNIHQAGEKIEKKFSHPTILYLGRIKKYKRVDLLVNIFSEILKKNPQARLIIAGWGTEASNVADLVMKNPLRRKISLMGPVSNAEKKILLSRSWVFVNPSIGEGWSLAVIEANLYGTPAVAFNVSGLEESIKDKYTGLLAYDKEDLVNKICQILEDKTLRDRLSQHATVWANSFDWDRSAKESIDILQKLKRN